MEKLNLDDLRVGQRFTSASLTVVSEVLDVAPSKSCPDRGIVTVRSETLNQKGEAVQVATMKLMVPRRG